MEVNLLQKSDFLIYALLGKTLIVSLYVGSSGAKYGLEPYGLSGDSILIFLSGKTSKVSELDRTRGGRVKSQNESATETSAQHHWNVSFGVAIGLSTLRLGLRNVSSLPTFRLPLPDAQKS